MISESTAFYGITRAIPRSLTSERLPFVLPDFNRHAWTSELARSIWEPRIARILRAWLDVEWLSVAAGTRECGLIWIFPETLQLLIPKWEAAHLSAVQLQFGDYYSGTNLLSAPTSVSGMICVVVGALDKTEQLRHAWQRSDDDEIGSLLGYPTCCRAFFRDVWIAQRCLDTTWAMAENTSAPSVQGIVRVELPSQILPLANILWRWLGVRAVPHLPCRFDCSASIDFGKRLLEIARNNGYSEEAEWITEILDWPVEWSALHGIAEVKSPLTKLSTRTDATAGKWVVQWVGMNYPKEGAVGLHFPFRPPRKPMLTGSQEARPGLADPAPEDPSLAWRYTDNGFASFAAMEELHKPIVALAREALAGHSGNVLDLGCGNGMLLTKVCAGRSALIPHGIDSNGLALDHARQLLPHFARNVVHGDFFNIELWAGGAQRYVLALLMLGRLLEVPRERSMRMINRLRESCSRVLVYVYPDCDKQPLEAMAQQFGLELVESNYQRVAFLK